MLPTTSKRLECHYISSYYADCRRTFCKTNTLTFFFLNYDSATKLARSSLLDICKSAVWWACSPIRNGPQEESRPWVPCTIEARRVRRANTIVSPRQIHAAVLMPMHHQWVRQRLPAWGYRSQNPSWLWNLFVLWHLMSNPFLKCFILLQGEMMRALVMGQGCCTQTCCTYIAVEVGPRTGKTKFTLCLLL